MSGRLFGLDGDEVRRLVASVRPVGVEATDWADQFARIAWTTLAEPGDSVAGALVGAVGPAAALRVVLERTVGSDVAGLDGAGLDRAGLDGAVLDGAVLDEPALGAVLHGLDVSPAAFRAAIARWTPRVSARSVVLAIEQAARFGIRCTMPGDPWWPEGLAALGPAAPLALWTRGALEHLVTPPAAVALVGARAATAYGEHATIELAAGVAANGVAVVSGGAYGIDGAAHRATLAAEATTIAVLAGGLDRYYPAGHEALLTRVAEIGLLIAEVPCGVPPTRWRFLQRNRIIAAITGATVVVEAGHRSGSLNTAGHAAAIGRPLGAVPGPVTSPTSAGCHRLLREYDATCITNAGDVLELLGATVGPDADDAGAPARADPRRLRVVDALPARSSREVGVIAGLAGMAVGEVMAVLGLLEADGIARRDGDGWSRAGAR